MVVVGEGRGGRWVVGVVAVGGSREGEVEDGGVECGNGVNDCVGGWWGLEWEWMYVGGWVGEV